VNPTHVKTSIGDYLRGYVTGYWEGWDFAESRPTPEGLEEIEKAIPTGDADAPSPAPGSGPALLGRSAPGVASLPAFPAAGPTPSADDSLPAIRQRGLPGDVEVAGELERIYIHRGMVTGLTTMAELLARLGMVDAARLCLAATDIERDGITP